MNIELREEDKIKVLNCEDVYDVMKRILLRENKIERDHEHVWMVCLNVNHKILNVDLVSLGAINETTLKPMQVFRVAILKGAISLIMVHNHTGDDLNPSEGDLDLTDQMIQVGNIVNVKVIDHLIINEYDFLSFKRCGLMEKLRKSKKWVPRYMEEERIRKEALKIGQQIGEKKGEKKGKREGKKIGKKIGLQEGEIKGKKETAIKMLKYFVPIENIIKYTGLSAKEIKKLSKEVEESTPQDQNH